jgi:hypothetical protein
VVEGDLEVVSIRGVHFEDPVATEVEAELGNVLRSGVGACIALDLAELGVRIGRLSSQLYLLYG